MRCFSPPRAVRCAGRSHSAYQSYRGGCSRIIVPSKPPTRYLSANSELNCTLANSDIPACSLTRISAPGATGGCFGPPVFSTNTGERSPSPVAPEVGSQCQTKKSQGRPWIVGRSGSVSSRFEAYQRVLDHFHWVASATTHAIYVTGGRMTNVGAGWPYVISSQHWMRHSRVSQMARTHRSGPRPLVTGIRSPTKVSRTLRASGTLHIDSFINLGPIRRCRVGLGLRRSCGRESTGVT